MAFNVWQELWLGGCGNTQAARMVVMRMHLTFQTWSWRHEDIFNTNYLLYLLCSAFLYSEYGPLALLW